MAQVLRPFANDEADVAAQRLVQKFGSPARLLSAPATAILEALHDRPALGAFLVAARDFADFAARAIVVGEPVDPCSAQMRRYLTATIGMRQTETVVAIYLDAADAFLASELLSMGSENTTNFPTRTLIARALETGARGIVLAHNHPSGLATPSEQDREATDHLRALSAHLGIELIDHLIVTGNQVFSMARGAPI